MKIKCFWSYGLDLFGGEIQSKKEHIGLIMPPTYEINHGNELLRSSSKFDPINVKLANRILIFADTRYRFGRVNLAQKEGTQSDKTLYPTRKYWMGVFEPLNSIGVRFNFKIAKANGPYTSL